MDEFTLAGTSTSTFTLEPSAVPEPSSLALAGTAALAGLGVWRVVAAVEAGGVRRVERRTSPAFDHGAGSKPPSRGMNSSHTPSAHARKLGSQEAGSGLDFELIGKLGSGLDLGKLGSGLDFELSRFFCSKVKSQDLTPSRCGHGSKDLDSERYTALRIETHGQKSLAAIPHLP